MKRIPLLFCLAAVSSLAGCMGPPGAGGYTPYQYSGYGPRYDDYYGYGPNSRWGYADRRVRPQFTRQMPPGRGRGTNGGPGGGGSRHQGGRPPGGGPDGGRGPGGPGPR